MTYGNVNGFSYTEEVMEHLINAGKFQRDEFFPINRHYVVYERENGEDWELCFLTFCTKEDARKYINGLECAHATDVAEGLVPACYTYEYEIREVTLNG